VVRLTAVFHSRGRPLPRASAWLVVAAWAVSACSPPLDWRELRPSDSGIQLQLPCKPQRHERSVVLAGQRHKLVLLACQADGLTWALAFADLADPARLGAGLQELAQAAQANITAGPPQAAPLQVPGATPHAASQRAKLQGKLPDGQAVQMHYAVFTHGTQVYQATVLGPGVADAAADTFMASLRFAR
jgi:hypothetical protein